ncbi:hypothetical protein Tco_0953783 [Tanacetum coccineum]|uniref:Uncharacterized protein n=1 Tax=Tanacetum coccineum TaxID=301880 RepID=A0ABQ5E191_9ASTR
MAFNCDTSGYSHEWRNPTGMRIKKGKYSSITYLGMIGPLYLTAVDLTYNFAICHVCPEDSSFALTAFAVADLLVVNKQS